MMTDQRAEERTAPHAPPSAIEAIAADHPAWEVSQERVRTWQASCDGVTLTAESTAGLLVRLRAQELARLRAEYAGEWRIWSTGRWWMATRRDGSGEPLMEDTVEDLEAYMRAQGRGEGPGGRANR